VFLKYNISGILWCLIILALTLVTGKIKSNLEFDYIDKVVHVLMFLPASFLIIVGLQKQSDFRDLKYNSVFYALSFCIIYGVIIELIQWALPHRYLELADIAANAVGATCGYLVYLLIYKTRFKWFF
jgi:VanZ family protein